MWVCFTLQYIMGIFPCFHINNRSSEYFTTWNIITEYPIKVKWTWVVTCMQLDNLVDKYPQFLASFPSKPSHLVPGLPQWSKRGQLFLTSWGISGTSRLLKKPRPAIQVYFSIWWRLSYIIEIRMFTPAYKSVPLLILRLLQNNHIKYSTLSVRNTKPDISTGDKLIQRVRRQSSHSLRLNQQPHKFCCFVSTYRAAMWVKAMICSVQNED